MITPIIRFEWYMVLLIITLWSVAFGGFGWYCAYAARQITYVTLADGRRKERRLPLIFRLLLPLAPNLTPIFAKKTFQKSNKKLTSQIISAG